MLSILIPVYNFDIVEMVTELHKQAKTVSTDVEIIVLDDNSTIAYKDKNRQIIKLNTVKLRELPKNIGRAKIRNTLADMAEGDFLIFIDCDSKIPDILFLKRYLECCDEDSKAVYGGLTYSEKPPGNPELLLRWHYGVHREVCMAEERKKHPNRSFKTINFMISKSVFDTIRFDESLSRYGHEDTLFGFELKKRNIPVLHIDNPVIHIGLETATVFLKKTQQGIKNLHKIYYQRKADIELIEDIKLLRYYRKLEKAGIRRLAGGLFSLFRPTMEANLKSKKPNLRILDLYKLGYMCRLPKP